MRFVLCMDGLEASLIDPETFPSLAQEHRGIVDLSDVLVNNHAITPVVWASFITGKPPEETGITGPLYMRWNNPLLQRATGRYVFGRRGRILTSLGFKRRMWQRSDLKVNPPEATYLNFPVLDRRHKFERLNRLAQMQRWDDVRMRCHRQERDALEADGGLVIAWLARADLMGHWQTDIGRLKADTYLRLETVAKKTREKADWVLIVSDHGTIDGGHTSYGFWSCTHPPPKQMLRVLDFHDWIF